MNERLTSAVFNKIALPSLRYLLGGFFLMLKEKLLKSKTIALHKIGHSATNRYSRH